MLALAGGCASAPPTAEPATSAGSASVAPAASPTTTSPIAPGTSTSAAPPAADDHGPLPNAVQPVVQGELTGFRVTRAGRTLLDAQSSGLARYNTSASCEVPGQPCYDAPTLDKVARIDLGAPPTVPGTETTFIAGHSNRFQPDDRTRGIFSALQDVHDGDALVLTTTRGVFVYDVTSTLSVAFDRLTSTDAVVRVRPDTVVAISCVIAPDRASYLGNYVVVGTLKASAPAPA